MIHRLKEKLRNDEVALGHSLHYAAPGLIEAMACGWDWIWIEGQHSDLCAADVLHCIRTADSIGLPNLVRVQGHEYGLLGPVLDMRPGGLIVPMVDTPEQAIQIVQATRFPPLGKRSYGGRRVIDVEGRRYCERANEERLLVAQIESPEAVANAHEIAAIPGIDGLFLGPDDLKLRLGLPIDTRQCESKDMIRAMETTVRGAKQVGKFAGCMGSALAEFRHAVSLGYRLIVAGSDVGFLRAASTDRLEELRGILDEVKER